MDSNKLHATCDSRSSLQLVTPRRYGPGKGTGHRRQAPGRLRSIALVENHHVAAVNCRLVVFHTGLTTAVQLNGIMGHGDPATIMGESLLRTADGDQLSFG